MSSQDRRFTVISTFSGCGGSSLGYKLAGGDIRLAVEYDAHAAATYRENFPDTPLFEGDIASLSVEEAMNLAGVEPGELDLFDGSPPCQGFSTAGKRQLDDPRNQLFREYVRLLQGLQPKTFVMENVPGMVQGKMKLVFAEMMRALKDAGYSVRARVLNAQYFGVPQKRRRMIAIGVRKDLGIEPSHPRPQTKPVSVGEAFQGLPEDARRGIKEEAYFYWLQLKPGQKFSEVHPKGHWFNGIKLDPTQPCPTVLNMVMERGGGAGLYHWKYPRVLNIAEVKRVFSYPDDFVLRGPFRQQWARLGNSVPPLFMKAIAEHIRDEILFPPNLAEVG